MTTCEAICSELRAALPPSFAVQEQVDDLIDNQGNIVYRRGNFPAMVRVEVQHPRDMLAVVIPVASLEDPAPFTMADQVIEASEISCAQMRYEWPSEWPTRGIAVWCHDCQTGRGAMSQRQAQLWRGPHAGHDVSAVSDARS